MPKLLSNDEWIFARRCYINGVAASNMARSLNLSYREADNMFDRFRKQGLLRKGHRQEMPITLPRVSYLGGSEA